MYPKQVTGWINECWVRGATAEATVTAIEQAHGIHLGLATVYRHRHNLTTQDLVAELLRQQQHDISHTDNEELKLKYRNELLKLYIPAMTINYNKNIEQTEQTVKHVIKFVDPDNPAETYPQSEVQTARRAGIIPQLQSKIQNP